MILRKRTAKLAILGYLTDGQWHYGLNIIRDCRIPAGIAYPALQDLENERRVIARWDDPPGAPPNPFTGHRRRLYASTEAIETLRWERDKNPPPRPKPPARRNPSGSGHQ